MEEYLRLYNLYHRIFLISLAGSVLFLIISMTLFFTFKIWRIIGELSGRTAKKTIAKMEEAYRLTGKLTPFALSKQETDITESVHVINKHFVIEKQIILIHTEEVI